MNTVLDVLFLRKPKIEYISPPVCEAIFSGSSTVTIILDPLPHLTFPTGLRLDGTGGRRRYLTWNAYPGQICYSVYFESDPGNPKSPYNLISECIPNGSVSICSAGFFKITAITPQGESAPTSPVLNDGNQRKNIPLPQFPGTTGYNLYKNPNVNNISGAYSLELGNFFGNVAELCASGCYRVSSITGEGETPLSQPICLNCALSQPCPPGFVWHPAFCGCTCPVQSCPTGFQWDAATCECLAIGGGGDTLTRTACLNNVYGESIFAPDSFVSPNTFTLQSGSLPPGITLTQESPVLASLAGTPTVPGTYTFLVQVTDANGRTAGYLYIFTVFGFTNGDPPAPVVGVPYSFQLTAGGGTAPYIFTVDSGTLPSGLTLDSNGLIHGTPT